MKGHKTEKWPRTISSLSSKIQAGLEKSDFYRRKNSDNLISNDEFN